MDYWGVGYFNRVVWRLGVPGVPSGLRSNRVPGGLCVLVLGAVCFKSGVGMVSPLLRSGLGVRVEGIGLRL